MLRAYAAGLFPMAEPGDGEIRWYSPDPRTIIPLETFHVPRSLKRSVAKTPFTVKVDTAFPEVIRLCASREDTWISGEIIRLFTGLFDLGYAHSVETWEGGDLAGGLYGVGLGGAFFGESMVSLRTDASKIALVKLVERLLEGGFTLLDTQFQTPHLARFGAIEISREEYMRKLGQAVRISAHF
jgi:leucyl/phenylalanyl-tRNA--protein transferase